MAKTSLGKTYSKGSFSCLTTVRCKLFCLVFLLNSLRLHVVFSNCFMTSPKLLPRFLCLSLSSLPSCMFSFIKSYNEHLMRVVVCELLWVLPVLCPGNCDAEGKKLLYKQNKYYIANLSK